jgi:glucan 1,3-beta-glucosidase
MALAAGLFFALSATNLTMQSFLLGDWVRGIILLALAVAVPAASAYAVAGGAARLHGFAFVLNQSDRQRSDWPSFILASLFAVSIVAAIQVALGLVFDPRYQDFPFAPLTPVAVAFCVVAFARDRASFGAGLAERLAAALLIGSALFIVGNEGARNWQAVWLSALLILLALAVLHARAAPDSK